MVSSILLMLRPLPVGLLLLAALCVGCRSLPPAADRPQAEASVLSSDDATVAAAFRVTPYLQRPEPDAMTVVWFSHSAKAGVLTVTQPGHRPRHLISLPTLASALVWAKGEPGPALAPPYRHVLRVADLQPGTRYEYRVRQSGAVFAAHFRTAPAGMQAVRVAVFADCETEPESTGAHVQWPAPGGSSTRLYPLDQTDGFAANLRAIAAAEPDLLLIAGDLVQTGGEQRDWDEFWRQLGPLAATVPILPALGNHDYYGGPYGRGYDGHAAAVARYLSYFLPPANGAANPAHEGRYYRVDYGPATFLMLDANNGHDDDPHVDTNHYMATPDAPDFLPGSPQATWLEAQLADAAGRGLWRFATLHQVPWSVGPHGKRPGEDKLSGWPVRSLDPLFLHGGLAALFAGHDEMYERSVVRDGEHSVQIYDVGIAGDGLRAPDPAAENPLQAFLAHTDSPEVWENGEIVSGGKHYGFLQVDISAECVILTPHYVLPNGRVLTYPDVVELHR